MLYWTLIHCYAPQLWPHQEHRASNTDKEIHTYIHTQARIANVHSYIRMYVAIHYD